MLKWLRSCPRCLNQLGRYVKLLGYHFRTIGEIETGILKYLAPTKIYKHGFL